MTIDRAYVTLLLTIPLTSGGLYWAVEASKWLPGYWAGAWEVIVGHPSTQADIERRLRAVPAMRALAGRAHEHFVVDDLDDAADRGIGVGSE